jgi:class 3 adenylate cyclase
MYLFWTCLICNFSVFVYERLQKAEFKARVELEAAQEMSERLLRNILPEKIVERLKQQNALVADSFEEVTVLFADLVGFTEFSAWISPTELVKLLNQIFSMFDELAARYEVEKIKTIGDAYMVVAGLPTPRHDHAVALAEMALAMQEAVANFNRKHGYEVRIRIGMNTGPVVAGVIGLKKWAYDLWGDTVNTASRMESHGIPGAIQVTRATYDRLKDQYLFEERGPIPIKGKGEMNTYLLKGKRNTTSFV